MIKRVNIYPYKINNSNYLAKDCTHASHVIVTSNSYKNLYCSNEISFKGVDVSNIIPQVASKPSSYRIQLANALGIAAEKLSSVLAPDELKEILRKAKPENFTTGVNFENVLDGKFNINLHMHTRNLGGTMSVKEVLNQATKYAEYRKKNGKQDPVIIAISNHDTFEGIKEAIEIIASNPKKYKDVRFVPAVEFNTVYDQRQIEVIGYCVNPCDEKLNKLISTGQEINKKYLQTFLEKQVNEWEASAGIPPEKRITLDMVIDANSDKHLNCLGSPGLMFGFTKSLKGLFAQRHWYNTDGIGKFSKEHGLKYGSFAINPGTPDLKTIIQTMRDSSFGFLGIAHPCRNLGGIDLRSIFSELKKFGIEAAETSYQYPADARFPKSFQDHAKLAAEQSGMISTGGCDNHNDNIFSNTINIDRLPDMVLKLLGINS